MEAWKNDSPVATLTIDYNYICLNSAPTKCLLGAAFKAAAHIPHFLPDMLLGSPRASQELNTKQHLTPACFWDPLESQTFWIQVIKQEVLQKIFSQYCLIMCFIFTGKLSTF